MERRRRAPAAAIASATWRRRPMPRSARKRLREAQGKLREEIAARSPRADEARAFVAGADQRERASGARFSEREIGQAQEGIRREADRPVSDPGPRLAGRDEPRALRVA